MPPDQMIGGILFLSCLSVCLSVVNFNLCYNFWTVRGRDFIFGMHTSLMMPFWMTPRSMTLWLTLKLKIAFWTLLPPGHSVSQTHLDFYAPGSNDRGHIVFVLSVCLSVVNFNLRNIFLTVRDRDFIFGMHTQLMTLRLKIAFWTLLPPGHSLIFPLVIN